MKKVHPLKGVKWSEARKEKLRVAWRSRGISKRRKIQILAWAKRHGRLPNRKTDKVTERRLGTIMENYLSVKSIAFDPKFRKLIYSKYPRKVHNKREHNKTLRINELFEFLHKYNRTPSVMIPEEKKLHSILQNYSRRNSGLYNPIVERFVFKIDKCFRTQVPKKFRRCINGALQKVDSKLKEESF